MSSLPPVASAAVAAMLLASMARAFIGAPARRPRRAAARVLLGVTAACYATGALVAVTGAVVPGALLVVAGIEASSLGAWLVRGGDGPPPDDPDGDGGPAPAPWDWDAFDRARAAWGRPARRPPAGV